jgi:hypothetical protein
VFRERGREGQDKPGELKEDYLELLEKDLQKLNSRIGDQRLIIFVTFTSDLFNPGDGLRYAGQIMDLIHRYGHCVNVLTKAGLNSVSFFDHFTDGDMYGATLTTTNPSSDEPLAAPPESRIKALKEFSSRFGKPSTWVSLEPVVNPDDTLSLLKMCQGFVGTFKVGKLNYSKSSIDWQKFTNELVGVACDVDSDVYVKKSLHQYLPNFVFGMISSLNISAVSHEKVSFTSLKKSFPKNADYINALYNIFNRKYVFDENGKVYKLACHQCYSCKEFIPAACEGTWEPTKSGYSRFYCQECQKGVK